jgi:hypothetical protein
MKDQKPLLFDATMMMMKYLTLLLAITSWLMEASSSFVIKPMASLRKLSDLKMAQVELMPEPQGGEELTAISTMEGTRMKNMGEVEGMKSEDGTVYKFWLQTIANGELVKEYKTTILKDAKKKVSRRLHVGTTTWFSFRQAFLYLCWNINGSLLSHEHWF